MTICFTVPGKPQGKARAGTFYNPKTKAMSSVTPEKTVLYENFISTCYLQAAGEERFFRCGIYQNPDPGILRGDEKHFKSKENSNAERRTAADKETGY